MPRDLPVCAPAELPPGQARLLEDGGRRVAVFNVGGEFHAIDDLCPHRQGPLSEGWMEGFLVACPWHGWQFDVTTGRHRVSATVRQPVHEVEERGGDVYVRFAATPAPEAAGA